MATMGDIVASVKRVTGIMGDISERAGAPARRPAPQRATLGYAAA
jgi:hypothetical protein